MSNEFAEDIVLTLPINAAYVSAARLTASSIAYRIGFDIDEIEDIKAAVSESCTLIIKKSPAITKNAFKITFQLQKDQLLIDLTLLEPIPLTALESEMSFTMIKALVDQMDVVEEDGQLRALKLLKSKKENIFHTLEG